MKSMKLLVSLICLLSASSIFAYDTAKSDSRKPKTTLTEIKTIFSQGSLNFSQGSLRLT